MRVSDRLYGPVELPPLAEELARSCPVLLRLREVRMANIPFASYPSFANVSRFEHSVGVAHLAWRFAQKQELPEDEALALTIAALYHDGASPAFGHLYEELLIPRGFDHEHALVELLTGRADLYGRADAQIFLGRRCRLPQKLPVLDESSVLSCHGIASILSGGHPLSRVIVGSIDIDNIDNVIRAATAMGVISPDMVHPYDIVDELVFENGELKRTHDSGSAIAIWQSVRQRLYAAILANSYEFRAQSAVKWAIADAARFEPELEDPANWTLTEPELVFDHLRHHDSSRELIDMVRRGAPPPLLVSANVQDISPLLSKHYAAAVASVCEEIGALVRKAVFLNFYVDKADRAVDLPLTMRSTLLRGSEASLASPTTDSRRPGVVGVVCMSRQARYRRDRHGPGVPPAEELAALVTDRLALEATSVSGAWIRVATQERLPTFA